MGSPTIAYAEDLNLFDHAWPSSVSSPDADWTYQELSTNKGGCSYRTLTTQDNKITLDSDSNMSGSTASATGSIAAGTGTMDTDNPAHNISVTLNARDANGNAASKTTTFSMPYATNTGSNFYMHLHNESLPYLDLAKLTGTLKFDAFTAASTINYAKRNFTIPKLTHTYTIDTSTTGTFGSKHSFIYDRMLFCLTSSLVYGSDTNSTYTGFKFDQDIAKGQKFQSLGRTKTVFLATNTIEQPNAILTSAQYYLNDWHLFVIDDSQAVELTIGDDGMYTSPIDGKAVILTYHCLMPKSKIDAVGAPSFYVSTPVLYKIDMLPTTETRNQTQELKDTTGSETVLNSVVNQNQSVINQKLGFIAQTSEIVGGTYDAFMNTESTGTITFPAVAWEGQTIIAAQQVPIIPNGFEDLAETIRTFNTGVLALLWVRGVRHLYGRIFLNETDVIVDDE